MIRIKTKEEIAILREGGARLAFILNELGRAVKPGMSTAEIDEMGQKMIEEQGDKAAFLNYMPNTAKRPYPASICVSVNDEVVHGIPNEDPKILKEGDIVSIDAGLVHKGLITDSAITVAVGKIDAESQKLLDITKKALNAGTAAAKPGKTTGDIGFAIQSVIEPHGYGIVEELCGHGVGYEVHEDPFVPNFGIRGRGAKLKEGMVIAIEPMVNEGTKHIKLDRDGYTYRTKDGKRSAHFEHTIVITDNGAEVLTRP